MICQQILKTSHARHAVRCGQYDVVCRALGIISIVAGLTCSTACADPKVEFFETRIRPVLVEHCYQCHSSKAKNVRGGLLLDSSEGMLSGGESGPTVVPGKPNEGLLLSSLRHEGFEMPPDRKLPDQIVKDFEKWIADGAVDPRTGGTTVQRQQIDLEAGRQFWSLQPVKRPQPPATTTEWARSDIDRFIEARFTEAGLQPAQDATSAEVLRRLYFGLTGLPPSPDDIRSFEAAWQADPDAAISAQVDHLLQSPRFGERWGRHWLDVVRFAESSGGGRSLMFPNAWRFRDYVIRSFNNDKPFPQFVREHIAGDLLPFDTDAQHDDQITGSGYLTLGPTNYEQQDKELLRMEVVDEQVDTIGRTFLGQTLGCARCHDHKFDPVPTSDYYALAGIFRSTKTLTPGNVSGYVTTSLKTGSDGKALKNWQSEYKQLESSIADLKAKLKQLAPTNLQGVAANSLPGIVVDNTQASFHGEWIDSTSVPVYVGTGYRHNDGRKKDCRVRFTAKLPAAGSYVVRLAYSSSSNRCVRVPVVIHHAEGSTRVTIDQRETPSVDGLFTNLGQFSFEPDSDAVVSIDAADSGTGVIIADAVQFLSAESLASTTATDSDAQQIAATTAKLKSLEAEFKQHSDSKPEQPVAMCVRDEDEPADWHIHIRGGIRNLGPVVPRGFLSVIGSLRSNDNSAAAKIADGESGRRELAEWIASPQNPLTTRVFVNRVWQHMIGEGLVRTPDNFGATGQQPTHPLLLDYLASTFVTQDGWSVKKLIRRIATSRVYRLSSAVDINTVDPGNLLLTRGFRRRLEAEALRDSILLISGQLDLTVTGGQTIQKLTTYDNGYDHDRYSRTVRSVYVPFFRNSMLEILDVFDVANSNLVTGRRTVSTLPSQALYLLNSPFILEQSTNAAEHFLQTRSADRDALDETITDLYLQTVGRVPQPEELSVLRQFVASEDQQKADVWAAVFQSLFASVDFRYLD